MVNKNYFKFDCKSFFKFWKTIYYFENRKLFYEIKLFVLTRTFDIRLSESSNCRSSESNRRQSPAISGCRRKQDFDYGLKLIGSCQNGRIRRSPVGIRPFWPDPAKPTPRNLVEATERCIFAFVIFSYELNAENYFRENYFF
jgi:hypothetical protein